MSGYPIPMMYFPEIVASSTWNPLDKGGSVVLSNGDLTATKSGAAYESVRGTIGKSAGALYFEMVVGSDSLNLILGVADSSFQLTTRYLGENNAGAKKSAGRSTTPTRFYRNLTNAASNSTVPAYGPGAVVGVGINFSTFTMTLYDGLTGTLIDTYVDASPWGTLYPAATIQEDAIVTLDTTGPYAFLPAGFVAWDSP